MLFKPLSIDFLSFFFEKLKTSINECRYWVSWNFVYWLSQCFIQRLIFWSRILKHHIQKQGSEMSFQHCPVLFYCFIEFESIRDVPYRNDILLFHLVSCQLRMMDCTVVNEHVYLLALNLITEVVKKVAKLLFTKTVVLDVVSKKSMTFTHSCTDSLAWLLSSSVFHNDACIRVRPCFLLKCSWYKSAFIDEY